MATDVRAVDGSEVVVRLGRREQTAGAAVPALGRERTAENGRFCMGILVTLSLSLKKAPIGRKNIFGNKVASEYPYELKFKRICKNKVCSALDPDKVRSEGAVQSVYYKY